MQPFQILTRRERCAVLAAAFVASLGLMSATLLPFAKDGDTPWFDASSDLALAAQLCGEAPDSSRRHLCLREVAQVAAQQASSPILLARH
jgi:hypothetical protein